MGRCKLGKRDVESAEIVGGLPYADGCEKMLRSRTMVLLEQTAEIRVTDPLTGTKHPFDEPITGVTSWELPFAPILQDWLLVLEVQQ